MNIDESNVRYSGESVPDMYRRQRNIARDQRDAVVNRLRDVLITQGVHPRTVNEIIEEALNNA